ncbi:hypothetical protein [Synechococcus sp. CCAP 1479/9]|uniref:hypothetical protein n=1 Tax=Synechococcus sp. CCAP 1479/9 TaxID=1221593 RepID=UPI001C238031|nr:hypothetical protein [Synechococcus sp. CCAP 1479/9]
MPESDPRRTRLVELRKQLVQLGEKGRAAPIGSPDRDRLIDRYGEVLAVVLALAEELEG